MNYARRVRRFYAPVPGDARGASYQRRALAWYHFAVRYFLFEVIQLSVNGQVQRVETGADVARLLQVLELSGKRVAVEKNGEIVPRSRYAETRLADGDALEIVVAVGGG